MIQIYDRHKSETFNKAKLNVANMLVEKCFCFFFIHFQEENEKLKQASAISALESSATLCVINQAGIHFAKLPGY